MCVCAHGLLVAALVHLTEPVPGAFPDLEELSHLGLALVICDNIHCVLFLYRPPLAAILVWVQD